MKSFIVHKEGSDFNLISNKLSEYTKVTCCNDLRVLVNLSLNSCYFSKCTSNDFIIVTGTFIYDNSKGQNALAKIYSDLVAEGIEFVRSHMFGNYSVLFTLNNELLGFVDYTSAFKIYYLNDRDRFVISSDLFELLRFQKDLALSESALREEVFVNACFGSKTIFNRMHRLQWWDYLRVDAGIVSTDRLRDISTIYPAKVSNDLLNEYLIQLKANARLVAEHWKNIGLFFTGGYDSRVILAAFLSVGIKPVLIYAEGNSFLTNTKIGDKKIVVNVAEQIGLDLRIIKWDNPEPIDKDWDDVFRLYSEESFIYGGSNSIFESIKQLEGIDFIEFGYFGESIRNLSWVENWQGSDIEKEEIAYEFLNHRAGNSTKGLNSTLISINMFIEEFFSIVDDHEELDIDGVVKFDSEYRKLADSHMLRLVNNSNNSCSLVTQSNLLKLAIGFSVEDKRGDRIPRLLIERLSPELAVIPYHSHQVMINNDRRIRTGTNKNLKSKVKTCLFHLKSLVIILFDYLIQLANIQVNTSLRRIVLRQSLTLLPLRVIIGKKLSHLLKYDQLSKTITKASTRLNDEK